MNQLPNSNRAPNHGEHLLYQLAAMYPRLGHLAGQLAIRYSPGKGGVDESEFYPRGESESFDPTRNAVEIFNPHTKANDVAGELVSHLLRNTNPHVRATYEGFAKSLTPKQHAMLAEQYQWALKHEGETRPFNQWKEMSGLPSMFRAYPFHQWPNAASYFTPAQRQKMDALVSWLRRTG